MTMFEHFNQLPLPLLTSCAEDSHASRTVSPAFVAQAAMNAIFGVSSLESFAKLGPGGSWLKMCQGYSQARLDGSLDEFSGTWPRSGLMRNGLCYPLQPSALPTAVIGSLSWPTPTANDGKNASCPPSQASRDTLVGAVMRAWPTPTTADATGGPGNSGRKGGNNLRTAVKMWATRTVNGNYNRKGASATSGDGLQTQVGGPLNPAWVEWLMGFPPEWTALDA